MMIRLLIFCLVLLKAQLLWGQVRIFQWSDAHSTLKTLTQQMVAIDEMSKEFLDKYPKAEIVVLVNGDFTSINDFSEEELGWLSLRSLEFLKQKGYTVIFIPGNHDAFDWTETLNGAELFFQQMTYLYSIDIPILASNIVHPKHPLKDLISKSYRLKTLLSETHLVGMTLDILPKKANLSDAAILRLMDRVEGYDETLEKLMPQLKKNKVERIFLAVHQGHKKLAKLAEEFAGKKPHIAHYFAGDDHVVASYKVKGSLVTDGGSHGSFNVIDYDEKGRLMKPIQHVAINSTASNYVDPELFDGSVDVNQFGLAENNPFFDMKDFPEFSAELNHLIETREILGQSVIGSSKFGFYSSKKDMKKGRTDLGSVVADSLEQGIRSLLSPDTTNLINDPIVAFVHSGSYKLEGYIQPGPITISIVKETYPYRNRAKAYRMTGLEISELYFSLKEFYSKDDPNKYTPQMNFNVQENDGKLEIYHSGKWNKLKRNKSYIVAFDGWLSTQNYGEGFRIPIWNEIFSKHEPIVSEIFQDIQLQFLPEAISNYESSLDHSSENTCSKYLLN